MSVMTIAREALRRARNVVARGLLKTLNDGSGLQTNSLWILKNEFKRDVERFQQYGFTGRPFEGAEAVILFPNGSRDHALVLAVDDRRYRMQLGADGEVALYDDQGQHVHIKRSGIVVDGKNIHLKSSGTIRIEGSQVEISGSNYLQTEVQGYGERQTHSGGANYTIDSYRSGAVTGGGEQGLSQPKLPSSHPES